MGRIFISAAHGGKETLGIDSGAIADGTNEARERSASLQYGVKISAMLKRLSESAGLL
ncbi:hypothetical protein [Iningainema tapete]|uniref:Uncharacterized protein n=1 Tax=Iningainema tapete BLCC-T55 TaxID=2748662 RepID=A0A8J6XPU5_9CYAN|nr:hypothetical protein [Iningainema tapete]MBD2777252.1 hypothetical protein [Iningainema tapete BLCC-T55]